MQYRKATETETNEILQLASRVAKEASMGYINESTNYPILMEQFYLASGGSYIVAIDNETLAGWVLAGKSFDSINNELIGFIPELYVFPEYRNNHIGSELMKIALDEYKKNGVKKVQLNVFHGNQAKNLYERLGFQSVSTLMEVFLT